jgi:hypothetical protein
MKVALVHDWLTGMRGGEKCLEVFCELYPDADLYTLLHVPGSVSKVIEKMRIHTSRLQKLPLSSTKYRYYLPFFPSIVDHWKPQNEPCFKFLSLRGKRSAVCQSTPACLLLFHPDEIFVVPDG